MTTNTRRMIAVVLVVALFGAASVPFGVATGTETAAPAAQGVSDSNASAAASEGTLSLAVGSQDGDTVPVTLETDAADVAGYGAKITFDPDTVEVSGVEGRDFGDPVTNVDNNQGWVFFTQSRAEGVDAPQLAEIEFTVRAGGQTDLEFVAEDTSVNDGSVPPETIPVDLQGATLTVEGAADGTGSGQSSDSGRAAFEFDSIDLSATSVPAGEPVTVAVDLANVGGSADNYELTLTADGTTVDTDNVVVGAGASTTVELSATFDEPGTYDLQVNRETAGTVDVTEARNDITEELPGFGVLAALGGLLVAFALANRRRD